MAVSPVNLCADLQAWHSAGLSFLYFPQVDSRDLARLYENRTSPGRSPLREAARPAAADDEFISEAGAAERTAPGRERGDARPKAGASPGNVTALGAAPSVSPSANDLALSPPVPADRPLPEAWAAVLRKVKPAPVVWTYAELGEDLLVQGSPERGKALRELIGSLALKGGTSTFLPARVPGGAADGSEAWCFQALLQRLGGRILVALGPEALALGPYASLGLEPFREKIVQGRMIFCLPAFSEILASPDRFEATRVFLRGAFSKINIL